MTDDPVTKPLLRALAGERQRHAADLADAASWTLSSGISGTPGKGRQLSRSVLQSETRRGSNVATDSPFWFRCGDLFSDILVVPHALGQRVTFEEGEGPRLDALSGPVGAEAVADESRSRPARAGLRNYRSGQAGPAAGCGVAWLLRCAVDRCDLYDRRPRYAGSAAGAAVCLSASASFCGAHR